MSVMAALEFFPRSKLPGWRSAVRYDVGMHNILLVLAVVVNLCAHAWSGPISSVATGGNPASLVVWGQAEAVAAIGDGTVLAARTRLGEGRVVCLGHGGFLADERGDTQAWIAGFVAWLAEGIEGRSVRLWGLEVTEAMRARGIEAVEVSKQGGERGAQLREIDVLVGSPQAFARAGRLEELANWIRGGGRMLMVETAWGQLQLKHAPDIASLAANIMLAEAGVMYTERALSPGAGGVYALSEEAAREANAEHALSVLAGERAGDIKRAARVAREALALVPLDGALVARARALAEAKQDELDAAYAAMAAKGLKLAEHPLACALMDLDARRAVAGDVRAHPSAAAFPGLVPDDLPRSARRVRVADGKPGWRSTGLFAAAGEAVTVRVVSAEVEAAAGLGVQIGSWLDPQDFDDRVRLPRAVYSASITSPETTLASPIGGPVYLVVPEDLFDRASEVEVEIAGAVEMPHYKHGQTDLDAWRSRLRVLPVAWAELESDELVFTIPASAVRELDRPDLVMEHWDRVHGVMQAMEPRSPRHWPARQYRYVADRRLSWGYMYCPADAPIVIPMSAAGAMTDLANFDSQGPNELWGHYHEMGHAHQNPMWTFGGTGEVTVNIFTVLALHQINGYGLDDDAMRTARAEAWKRFDEHSAAGTPFDAWKRDPFLALQTYAMLWHEFGWDAFRATFRAYDDLPAGDRPRSDEEKRDRFVILFSRTVGKNLGPYFRTWGVPLTPAVEEAVSALPDWMPQRP